MLLLVALLCTLGATARAQAVDAEDGFVARVSQERATRGLPGFAVVSDLQAVARRHAQRMADRGTHYHNPNLGSEVQNWSLVAENVGYGPSVDAVHQAFMASSAHRANILSIDLTQVGIGVVRGGDGRLWVVQVFRRPAATAPPATAPPTTVAPAPASPPPTAPPTTPTTPPVPPVTLPPQPAVTSPPPTPGSGDQVAAAPVVEVLSAPLVSRTAAAPDLAELATDVPRAARVGAFLLAVVVGLQGHTLRRLRLL